MKLSFRYKSVKIKYESTEVLVRRPIIPITIGHGEKNIDIEAFLDSGSDFILITKEIAEFLALDLGKTTAEVGICGERCRTVRSAINMKITDGNETVRLFNIPVEVIMEGGIELEEMLIGRIPFFYEFDITFKENSNKIELFRTKRN